MGCGGSKDTGAAADPATGSTASGGVAPGVASSSSAPPPSSTAAAATTTTTGVSGSGQPVSSSGSASSPMPIASAPAPATSSAPAPASVSSSEQNPHLVPQEKKEQKWAKPNWTNRGKDVPEAGSAPAAAGGGAPTATKQVIGGGIAAKVAGLQAGGMRTTAPPKRKMKTPKIVTDIKETRDREGNITREITRYITEPDGTKRTEKETVQIPAS